jgi:hypothetical protein
MRDNHSGDSKILWDVTPFNLYKYIDISDLYPGHRKSGTQPQTSFI